MFRARRIAAALLAAAFVSAAIAHAQPASPAASPNVIAAPGASVFPWEGEVTGSNVRVRSGAGTDWYATTKVNVGDHVLVVGEHMGWYQIAPLPRSFSYIDMTEVQRNANGRTGTVKKDRAFVRAGSDLAASKSTTQVALNQGAVVEILGEADGFYKIKSPPTAWLYITRQYVRPIAAGLRTGMAERYAAAAGNAPTAANPAPPRVTPPQNATPVQTPAAQDGAMTMTPIGAAASPTAQPSNGATPPVDGRQPIQPGQVVSDDMTHAGDLSDPEDGPPIEADSSIHALQKRPADGSATSSSDLAPADVSRKAGRFQALLTTIESDLNATMLLPLEERDLDSLIHRYQEVAVQNDEKVPAEYARIRVTQLQTLADLRKARADATSKATDIEAYRARMTTERMKILRARAETTTEKFDFVGELRKSYAFAPEKRRYRLVDPKRQTTIAYIDIPHEVTENAEFMIGRTVGIRTSGQRYSQAARIPIGVAASITDLTPTNPQAGRADGATAADKSGDTKDVMPPPLVEPEPKKVTPKHDADVEKETTPAEKPATAKPASAD